MRVTVFVVGTPFPERGTTFLAGRALFPRSGAVVFVIGSRFPSIGTSTSVAGRAMFVLPARRPVCSSERTFECKRLRATCSASRLS